MSTPLIFIALLSLFNSSYSVFEKWVDDSLSLELPAGIEAFCFNLYDDGDNCWSVEIIGAASFDPVDSDWACDEIFNNRPHPLRFKSKKSWDKVLASVTRNLERYLKNGKYASLLRSKKGVAIGFVEGDLNIIN